MSQANDILSKINQIPFAEIGTAFAHMEANRHLGKIVVTL